MSVVTRTRQQLALDLLLKRAEGKLDHRLRFQADEKPAIVRAVFSTNQMFESQLSTPFLIHYGTVEWNVRWLKANHFDKPLYPEQPKKKRPTPNRLKDRS